MEITNLLKYMKVTRRNMETRKQIAAEFLEEQLNQE